MSDSNKPVRNIVLLGKTGDGKSSSGNTILRKQIFSTESGPESVTAKRESRVGTVGGRKVRVIDTPGIFDTHQDEESIKSEIIKCIVECSPAVDAYVIVLKVERYTKQEEETVDKIIEYCGEKSFNEKAVVLFTHGEQLNGQTIEEFVKKSPKLQELVNKCGGRCHVIDNKYWRKHRWGDRSNRVQVEKLMKTIDEMVKENGCYTNELFQILEEDIQEEMKNNSATYLSPEEKREVAKKSVLKKLLVRLAGVTTGILTGAFLGICVAVRFVMALLKITKEIVITVNTVSILANNAAAMATVAGGAVAAAGTGLGAAAGTGIAVGVIFGAAALAGAIGGGITGYRAADEAYSVRDAIKKAARANCENAKGVVQKAEQLPSNAYKKLY